MRGRKYSRYRPSGYDWLGEIPTEWNIRRVSTIGNFTKGRGIGKDEVKTKGFPCIRYGEIYTHYDLKVTEPVSFIDEDSSNNSERATKGSILLTGSGETREEIGKAIAYIGERDIFVGGDIIILKLNKSIDPGFMSYVLNSDFLVYQKARDATGDIIVHIYSKKLREMKFALPPSFLEQNVISNFLDQRTSRIDSLIEKKQKQIELLQEKRSALISHAVTKGLDPNVAMKDSGVEWLGEIPEHWDSVKVKYLTTKIGSGKTPRGGSEVYVDSGVMLLRSQNVHFTGLKLEEVVFIEPEIDREMSNTRVQHGDVLLNITGASLGRSCLVGNEIAPANVNQHVCILRPSIQEILPEYLSSCFCSAMVQHQIFANENGTSREGLNFQQVGNIELILPPTIHEQMIITSKLNIETSRIDSIIVKINRSIELLKEYRTALISASVTGKIDVRGEVN
jgi:type I restriction enzyme S subunit